MLRLVGLLLFLAVPLVWCQDNARIVSVTLVSSVTWEMVRYDLNLDYDRDAQARQLCEVNLGEIHEENYWAFTDCVEQITCHMLQFDNKTPETCMKRYEESLPDYIVSSNHTSQSGSSADQPSEGLQSESTTTSSQEKENASPLKPLYSSFRCVGGSQHMPDLDILRHTPSKFPRYDPQYRHCMFTNVCFMIDAKYPTMAYFRHPRTMDHISSDDATIKVPPNFRLESQSTNLLQLGALSGHETSAAGKSFLPLHYVDGPLDASKQHVEDHFVAFVGSPSWPNYGHYLIDHVLPTFASAGLWNVPLRNVLQVLDNSCLKMKKVNPYLPFSLNRTITNQEYCMGLYRDLSHHFFDQPPLFLDDTSTPGAANAKVCFRKVIIGQNSALGANTTDLSRAHWLRSFRDHVVGRLALQSDVYPDTTHAAPLDDQRTQQEKQQIFVSYKGAGLLKNDAEMSDFNSRLCEVTQRAHALLLQQGAGAADATSGYSAYQQAAEYEVRCGAVCNISFAEEVQVAQSTSILVTHDGTISYTALFLRDNSEVLVVSPTKAHDTFKENQYFMWATHFHVYWVQEEHIEQVAYVAGILLQAMINRQNFA